MDPSTPKREELKMTLRRISIDPEIWKVVQKEKDEGEEGEENRLEKLNQELAQMAIQAEHQALRAQITGNWIQQQQEAQNAQNTLQQEVQQQQPETIQQDMPIPEEEEMVDQSADPEFTIPPLPHCKSCTCCAVLADLPEQEELTAAGELLAISNSGQNFSNNNNNFSGTAAPIEGENDEEIMEQQTIPAAELAVNISSSNHLLGANQEEEKVAEQSAPAAELPAAFNYSLSDTLGSPDFPYSGRVPRADDQLFVDFPEYAHHQSPSGSEIERINCLLAESLSIGSPRSSVGRLPPGNTSRQRLLSICPETITIASSSSPVSTTSTAIADVAERNTTSKAKSKSKARLAAKFRKLNNKKQKSKFLKKMKKMEKGVAADGEGKVANCSTAVPTTAATCNVIGLDAPNSAANTSSVDNVNTASSTFSAISPSRQRFMPSTSGMLDPKADCILAEWAKLRAAKEQAQMKKKKEKEEKSRASQPAEKRSAQLKMRKFYRLMAKGQFKLAKKLVDEGGLQLTDKKKAELMKGLKEGSKKEVKEEEVEEEVKEEVN